MRFILKSPIRIRELMVSSALAGSIFPSAPTAPAKTSGCTRLAITMKPTRKTGTKRKETGAEKVFS
jgi:hypothetical protein